MSTSKYFGSKQPTFVVDTPKTRSPKFSFVTITDPSDLHAKSNKRKIRQHAKRGVDSSRARKYRARFESVESDLNQRETLVFVHHATRGMNEQASPAQYELEKSFQPPEAPSRADSEEIPDGTLLSTNRLRPIGGGRGYVPFAAYPIQPTARMVQLFDYIFEAGQLHHQPMRLLWINVAMSDRDAFNISLAEASHLNFEARNKYTENEESLCYYNKAIGGISKRLASSADCMSDGVIGTILGLACLDVTYRKWNRWSVHMGGVRRILQLRGGLESLHSSYSLYMIALWNDIGGSLPLDRTPWFPRPSFILPRKRPDGPHRLDNFVLGYKNSALLATGLGDTLYELASLTDSIEKNGLTDDQSQQELFIALQVNPIIHDLLSIPRPLIYVEKASEDADIVVQEIVRTSALVFTGFIRKHCQIGPTGLSENGARLTKLLKGSIFDWSSDPVLQLWILTMSALASPNDRADTVAQISSTIELMGLGNWFQVVDTMKSFIWSNIILNEIVVALGDEVEGLRASSQRSNRPP